MKQKIQRSVLKKVTQDPTWVKVVLILFSIGFVAILLVLPLILIFIEAFRNGLTTYFETFQDEAARQAIYLTLLTTVIVVPFNTLFGVLVAYLVTKFQFTGKAILMTLIDLPIWISPVISGLVFVLLFGAQGIFGPWLQANDLKIIFTPIGIVLATLFVTFPFVARTLIPVMESSGKSEEEAALTLGARGWTLFFKVTLPKVKWGLLYGVILCNARAMGEFGAVSVVSGHIRGLTNTIPLHIEVLYNEYQMTAAFAMASLLSLLALITLSIKIVAERKTKRLPV